jgi:hypothetical protein
MMTELTAWAGSRTNQNNNSQGNAMPRKLIDISVPLHPVPRTQRSV